MSPGDAPAAATAGAPLTGVSRTCQLTAALRSAESQRPDRLFDDPFSAALAGPAGTALLAEVRAFYAAHAGVPSTAAYNAIRTRHFDDLLRQRTGAGCRQVVLVAAGMDARAYRLDWPPGTTVFELDHADVLTAKAELLAGRGRPRCRRYAVAADLAGPDWPTDLLAAGYRPDQPASWLVEGLLYYLPEAAVGDLLGRVARLTTGGCTLHADVIATSALHTPVLQPMLDMYAGWGAPWLSGMDDPVELCGRHGWRAQVTRPGDPAAHYGRWTPADAAAARLVPLSFVHAERRT